MKVCDTENDVLTQLSSYQLEVFQNTYLYELYDQSNKQ